MPESRTALLDAVRTPMSFFVLGLLVVDGTIAGMAMSLPDYRGILVGAVVISVPLFMAIVAGLSVFRPEALRGDRPLQEVYSRQFASDIYVVIDGYLRNLESRERVEAWQTVADVITNETERDATYSKFCAGVASNLRRLANIAQRSATTPGPIRENS